MGINAVCVGSGPCFSGFIFYLHSWCCGVTSVMTIVFGIGDGGNVLLHAPA